MIDDYLAILCLNRIDDLVNKMRDYHDSGMLSSGDLGYMTTRIEWLLQDQLAKNESIKKDASPTPEVEA